MVGARIPVAPSRRGVLFENNLDHFCRLKKLNLDDTTDLALPPRRY